MRGIKVFIAIASAYAVLNYGFGVFGVPPVDSEEAGSAEVAKLPVLDLREVVSNESAITQQPFSIAVLRPKLDELMSNINLDDSFGSIIDRKINIYEWDINKASDKELRALIGECKSKIREADSKGYNPTFEFAFYDSGALKAMIAMGASSPIPFHDYSYDQNKSAVEYLKKYRVGYASFVIESTSEGFGGISRYAAQYFCDIKGPGNVVVTRGLVHYF